MQEMKLQDLKTKSPTELLSFAEEVEVENASAMRKQELMFAILKQLAAHDVEIIGDRRGRGAAGRLRLPALARRELSRRPRRHLRLARRRSAASACAPATRSKARSASPKEGERYFALLKVNTINFEDPEKHAPQDPFRQSDAALSRRVAEDGDRRPDHQGQDRRASSTSSRRSARASAR